jgi:hypothetical protein
MRKMGVVLVAALAVCLAGAPAGAKELHSAKICGQSECATVTEKGDLRAFVTANNLAEEPPSGPFFTIKLTVLDDVGEEGSWTVDYMPSSNLIRTTGNFGAVWYELDSDPTKTGLSGLLRKLEPFPASAFDAATAMPPGEFTADDLATLSEPPPAAEPASTTRPDTGGTGWVLPLILVVGAGVVIAGSLAFTRRRAQAA